MANEHPDSSLGPEQSSQPVQPLREPAREPARKRRRSAPTGVLLHEKNGIIDGLCLSLLTFAALGSGFAYGASWDRMVSVWPFYIAMHLGLLLFCLKPFFNRSYRRFLLPPGALLAGAVLIYVVLHWQIWSKVPDASRAEIFKLFSFLGAFIVWTELAATRKRWVWLIAAVLFAGSLMSWYAFIQDFKESNMVLFRERPEQYGDRASATYICPNHFAHFAAMVLIVACGLLVSSDSGALLRVLSIYAIPLCGYTLFLSQSRSGILGVVAGVACTWLLLGLKRSFMSFVLALLGLLLLFGGGIFAAWQMDDSFRHRVEMALDVKDIRMEIWPDTIDMIEAEPVLGTGPGTYRHTFPPYRNLYSKPESTLRYAHNEFLHMVAEYGAVGMGIAGLMLLWVILRLLRVFVKAEKARDAGLAAILIGLIVGSMVHAAFDFNFQLFSNPHVFIMICGAIMGRLFVSGYFKPLRIRRWGMYVLALLSMAAILVTGLWATQSFFSSLQEAQAETYDELLIEEGFLGDNGQVIRDPLKNFKRYERMVKYNPSDYRGYALLGRAWHDRGDPMIEEKDRLEALGTARENYEKALELNPYDDESLMGLAILRDSLGETEEADQMFKKLMAMEPFHPDYKIHYGMIRKSKGDWSGALEAFKAAAKLKLVDENAIRVVNANLRQSAGMLGVPVPPLVPMPVKETPPVPEAPSGLPE